MLEYVFEAREPGTGRKVKSLVQATDEAAAAKLIKDQGLSPIDIKLKSGQTGGVLGNFRNKIPTKEKVIFARQISTLINAGLPIVQGIQMTADQTKNKPFKVILGRVASDVENGNSMSQALSKHPSVFSPTYVGVIAAGETSGSLDESLVRLADQQERDAEITSKIRGAMLYPAIVIAVMLLVVTFMVVKVLPQVEVMYKGIPGAELPFLTRFLLAIAHFVSKYWWVVVGLILIFTFFSFRWLRTPVGQAAIDRFKLSAPVINRLYRKLYMARFARTGGTLLKSGVPLLQALQITADAVGNGFVAESIKNAAEKVRGGKALSDCLVGDPNFYDLVPSMLRIGEQSGSIETMMNKTAEYYEKELDNEIKAISTIIEPVLMILLGVMALIIIAAILMPIYGLVGKFRV